MSVVKTLLQDVPIPQFYKVSQQLNSSHIDNTAQAVRTALRRAGTLDRIRPGSTVCFSAPSREIADIAVILRTLVEEVRHAGATPYIVPGMGSHGGATAHGQRSVLEHYGITEEFCGCEIHASMDTGHVGFSAEGLEVRMDTFALSCDYVVPVGRIKPHTDFHGPFESGIMKMLAIGLGKQHGASICHRRGFDEMPVNIPSFGRTCLRHVHIPFAVGIVENAFHQLYAIHAIPNECVEVEEPKLLLLAKSLMPSIPFEKMDVLMLEQIGKDISGDGMDPNIVGRGYNFRGKPWLHRIGVLDLSPKTGGNFNGIGNADATTRRVLEKSSFEEAIPNAITSIVTEYLRIPAVLDSDKLCMQMCLRTCPDNGMPLKVMWAKNTLHMREFYVSASLKDEIAASAVLSTDGCVYEIEWDDKGGYVGFQPVS